MTTVFTQYGPGEIVASDTQRGRLQYKVAGNGFEVWLDEAKVPVHARVDVPSESRPTRRYQHQIAHRPLAWAEVDRDNSVNLPYDPDPQYPALPGDIESTIQPIHEIDADERLHPADSISFDHRERSEGDRRGTPGPNPDLFAKGAALVYADYEDDGEFGGYPSDTDDSYPPEQGGGSSDFLLQQHPGWEQHTLVDLIQEAQGLLEQHPEWAQAPLGDLVHIEQQQEAQGAEPMPPDDAGTDMGGEEDGDDEGGPDGFGEPEDSGEETDSEPDSEDGESSDESDESSGDNPFDQGESEDDSDDETDSDSDSDEDDSDEDRDSDDESDEGVPDECKEYVEERLGGWQHRPEGPGPNDPGYRGGFGAPNYGAGWDDSPERDHQQWMDANPEAFEEDSPHFNDVWHRQAQWQALIPLIEGLGDAGAGAGAEGAAAEGAEGAEGAGGLPGGVPGTGGGGGDKKKDPLVDPNHPLPLPDLGYGYGDLVTPKMSSWERPAGLDDRYADIVFDAEYHDDPVAQFRHDPVGFIHRWGHVQDEGLNPRFAEYVDQVEHDVSIREAAWKDVRTKALRLRREGHVHVKDIDVDRIYATVQGDHGIYDTMIAKGAAFGGFGGGHAISNWHCSCEWGKWAFKRRYTYVGRLCSHGYAAYLEMQSAHVKGKAKLPKQTPYPKRRKKKADALQMIPQRLVPELVVNDTDDTEALRADVTKDERKTTGPGQIVHFSTIMARCDRDGTSYPRDLVAFLVRHADDPPDQGATHRSPESPRQRTPSSPGGVPIDPGDEHGAQSADAIPVETAGGRYPRGIPGGGGGGLDFGQQGAPKGQVQDRTAPGNPPAPVPGAPGQAPPAAPPGGGVGGGHGGNGWGTPAAPAAPAAPAVAGPGGGAGSPAGVGGGAAGGAGIGDAGGAGAWKPNGNTDAIKPGDYQIQQGDTLSDIAQRSGLGGDYQSLADSNKIADPNKINAGDTIKIPGTPAASDTAGTPGTPPANDPAAPNAPDKADLNPGAPDVAAGVKGTDTGPNPAAPAAPAAPAVPDVPAPKPTTTTEASGAKGQLHTYFRRYYADADINSPDNTNPALNDPPPPKAGAPQPAAPQPAAPAAPVPSNAAGGGPALIHPGGNPLSNAKPSKADATATDEGTDGKANTPADQNTTAPTAPKQSPGDMGDMGNVMGEIGDVAGGIGSALAPAIGEIGTQVAPMIGDAVSGLGSGLASGLGGALSGLSGIFGYKLAAEDGYPTAVGLPHLPFEGSGRAGPLEIHPSTETLKDHKYEDVTDLGGYDLGNQDGLAEYRIATLFYADDLGGGVQSDAGQNGGGIGMGASGGVPGGATTSVPMTGGSGGVPTDMSGGMRTDSSPGGSNPPMTARRRRQADDQTTQDWKVKDTGKAKAPLEWLRDEAEDGQYQYLGDMDAHNDDIREHVEDARDAGVDAMPLVASHQAPPPSMGGVQRVGKPRQHAPVVPEVVRVYGGGRQAQEHVVPDLPDPYSKTAASFRDEDDGSSGPVGNDIVAQFQRSAGAAAIMTEASSGGGGADDFDISGNAAQFLTRTAGRNYSLHEQAELMNEKHPLGARNLDQLDLTNTHYEAENSVGLW